jgi:5-methylcytosine-specific restriction endonuclease McrA
MVLVELKTCKVCGCAKELDEFNSYRSQGKIWKRTACRDCYKVINRKYSSNLRARRKALDEDAFYATRRAEQKRWREQNPERAKAHREKYQQTEKWKRLREPSRVRARERYWEHPDAQRAKDKAWRDANPDKVRSYWSRSDAVRRMAVQDMEAEHVSRAYIITRDGSRCHICGKKCRSSEIHLDHLVPISRGGTHTAANLRVACAHCNLSRGAGRIPAQLLLVG